MKVLFIGGTGTISYNCSKLAIEKGFEVSLLNRGKSTLREPLVGAELISADIRQPDTVRQALGDRHFDVIVEFVAFNPSHIEVDLDLFWDEQTNISSFLLPVPIRHRQKNYL